MAKWQSFGVLARPTTETLKGLSREAAASLSRGREPKVRDETGSVGRSTVALRGDPAFGVGLTTKRDTTCRTLASDSIFNLCATLATPEP